VYLTLGFFNINNVVFDVFKEKYPSHVARREIIMTDLPTIGQAIAAVSGGQLLQFGRRKIAMIGLIGACICGLPLVLKYNIYWNIASMFCAFF